MSTLVSCKAMLRLPVSPVAKPRMTQRDKWKKRPCVVKYWEYCNELRAALGPLDLRFLTQGCHIFFIIPVPPSWSKKKRALYSGTAHMQRPDLDNLEKAFFDALLPEDSVVWHGQSTKLWGEAGEIVLVTGIRRAELADYVID